MSAPLSVRDGKNLAPWLRAQVASLPRTLRFAEGASADLTVIEGQGAWTSEALDRVNGGARRILVVDPEADEPSEIQRLADVAQQADARLILSEGFAGNPAIAGFCENLDGNYDNILLRGWADTDNRSRLLTQIRIARALGIQLSILENVIFSTNALLAEARGIFGGSLAFVSFGSTRTQACAARYSLTAHSPTRIASLVLFDATNARPGEASFVTAEGSRSLPTIYESAHRRQLRLLASDDESGSSVEELRGFAEDVALTRAAGN